MKKEKDYRKRLLKVLFTVKEFAALEKKIAVTTCRHTSEYARLVLLNKPVLTKYRNIPLDEFLPAATGFYETLTAIDRNFTRILRELRNHGADREVGPTLDFLLDEEFVGMVADTPDQPIGQKTICCKLVNDPAALAQEVAGYADLPVVAEVTEKMVMDNFLRIRGEVVDLIAAEMERIKNMPELVHLLL